MILWIDGPYGVGKSTLAEKLQERNPHSFIFDAEEVGNAVRDNRPESLFRGYIFEEYPMWFQMCAELLLDIVSQYDGDIYIPMTLTKKDSFEKIERKLTQNGIKIKHILLESSYRVVHDRILARGESEDCWCVQNIDLCLREQKHFDNVLRIQSYGKTPDELAEEVLGSIKEM